MDILVSKYYFLFAFQNLPNLENLASIFLYISSSYATIYSSSSDPDIRLLLPVTTFPFPEILFLFPDI
jgi:hypothetical protein